LKFTGLPGIKLLAVAALIFGGLGLIAAASLAAVGTPDANLRFFFTFFDAALNVLVAYGFWLLPPMVRSLIMAYLLTTAVRRAFGLVHAD
jgi:hypothetical protein